MKGDILICAVMGNPSPPRFNIRFAQIKSLLRSHGLSLHPAPQARKFRSIPREQKNIIPPTRGRYYILCGYGESNPDLILGKDVFYH